MTHDSQIADIAEILTRGYQRYIDSQTDLSIHLDKPALQSDVSNPGLNSPSYLTKRGSDV